MAKVHTHAHVQKFFFLAILKYKLNASSTYHFGGLFVAGAANYGNNTTVGPPLI